MTTIKFQYLLYLLCMNEENHDDGDIEKFSGENLTTVYEFPFFQFLFLWELIFIIFRRKNERITN